MMPMNKHTIGIHREREGEMEMIHTHITVIAANHFDLKIMRQRNKQTEKTEPKSKEWRKKSQNHTDLINKYGPVILLMPRPMKCVLFERNQRDHNASVFVFGYFFPSIFPFIRVSMGYQHARHQTNGKRSLLSNVHALIFCRPFKNRSKPL